MPQQLVFAANTMDYFRLSINGLAANINFASETAWGNGNITGNIIVTGKTSSDLALNVANGTIRANGYLLPSLNALNFIGTANNARLQNTNFSIPTQLGLSSNIIVVSLGSTISINVAPVDSISNNRTDLPASANSIQWVLSVANTNVANIGLMTSGVLEEIRGGTGETSYVNGETLIGNDTTGALDKATITAGLGMNITNGPGTIRANLNLLQGSGILLTEPATNGAFTITANGYQTASLIQPGLMTFLDSFTSISTTDGVTANAVNAVYTLMAGVEPQTNAYGRLLQRNVFTTSAINGNTRFTWTKQANAQFIRVICIGGGAGGANAITDGTTSNISVSSGGGSGATFIGVFNADDFSTTETVQAGGGGQSADGDYSGFVTGEIICGGGKSVANTKLFPGLGSLYKTGVTSNTANGGIVTLGLTPTITSLRQDGEPGQASGLYGNMLVVGGGGSTVFGTGGQANVASLATS
jgi:hypothetical protein